MNADPNRPVDFDGDATGGGEASDDRAPLRPLAPPTAPAAGMEAGGTVLGLIKGLQSGRVTGSNLAAADRRRVVEHLSGEGYSVAQIAEVLKVSERTLARDRAAIRQANALEPGPELVGQAVGALVTQAEATVGRLRRLARDRSTPAAVRAEAEMNCWTVARQLVHTLQQLGYLPTAPQQVRADLTHRLADAPGYEQMQAELTRVELVLRGGGGGGLVSDPAAIQRVTVLKDTLQRLALGRQIEELSAAAGNTETDDGRRAHQPRQRGHPRPPHDLGRPGRRPHHPVHGRAGGDGPQPDDPPRVPRLRHRSEGTLLQAARR